MGTVKAITLVIRLVIAYALTYLSLLGENTEIKSSKMKILLSALALLCMRSSLHVT